MVDDKVVPRKFILLNLKRRAVSVELAALLLSRGIDKLGLVRIIDF